MRRKCGGGKRPTSIIPYSTLVILLVGLTGCSRTKIDVRPTLRLSMIPTTDPGKIIRESQPLLDYLQKKTGTKVELTVPTNYAAVVEAVSNDRVDIAYFGGFTFVQASARAGAVPLVQREGDQAFHSKFITQPSSSIHSLSELKGHSFAFGDVNSTSGHLMPAYFMRQQGVDRTVIEKAVYTGGHDGTALAVANGKVDAGAMDELVFARMMKEGKLSESQVRVFYTTPPFFDYVWAARKGLDPAVSEAFANALLDLDPQNADQKPILQLLNATKYVRAKDSSYDPLRQAAKDEGLLK
ncbi:MAG TPA: putative selenate ABC transporter substrate-binding protein [Candidatus Acidoferrum sp.]|nr:putative selenate ABC transporter substrate-binding protein [Candidatus Acidoferrum sp.]